MQTWLAGPWAKSSLPLLSFFKLRRPYSCLIFCSRRLFARLLLFLRCQIPCASFRAFSFSFPFFFSIILSPYLSLAISLRCSFIRHISFSSNVIKLAGAAKGRRGSQRKGGGGTLQAGRQAGKARGYHGMAGKETQMWNDGWAGQTKEKGFYITCPRLIHISVPSWKLLAFIFLFVFPLKFWFRCLNLICSVLCFKSLFVIVAVVACPAFPHLFCSFPFECIDYSWLYSSITWYKFQTTSLRDVTRWCLIWRPSPLYMSDWLC